MISDGNGTYIRKDYAGKYSPVRNESLADTWEQYNEARKVLQHCLNKNLRSRYSILAVEIPDKGKIVNVKTSKKEVKQVLDEEIKDDQIEKWKSVINFISNSVSDLEARKEYLNNSLSDIDKEIVDIQHFIEFGDNFNAYQGWLAFSLLRNRLKQRRKIKDELHIVMQLSECKINSSMISDVKDSIHKMAERIYTPRRLTSLFTK